jgi:hypothetical protein
MSSDAHYANIKYELELVKQKDEDAAIFSATGFNGGTYVLYNPAAIEPQHSYDDPFDTLAEDEALDLATHDPVQEMDEIDALVASVAGLMQHIASEPAPDDFALMDGYNGTCSVFGSARTIYLVPNEVTRSYFA